MDGFAVHAADTFGASDGAPAYLRIAGEVCMGRVPDEPLRAGTAVVVHTGAMLPAGADAVVILEETTARGDDLEIWRAVAPGDNMVDVGEDVRAGEPIWDAGHRLRAQDLGALHALGVMQLDVRRKPVVAVLSSGDEVVTPSLRPPLGSVRDVNAITLAATIERAGGSVLACGIVGDDAAALLAAAQDALARADMLVLSAGSSVSARDLTARTIAQLGAPGVLVHGVALRPGKPTILALCDGKPVIGVPGNPASALVVAWRFIRPIVHRLLGAPSSEDGLDDADGIEARLTASLPSRAGREDYVPARLERDADGAWGATPLFGMSTLIFSLVRCDGWIQVPLAVAGAAAGARVHVIRP
jgi:molybdopterin molybdotransferase